MFLTDSECQLLVTRARARDEDAFAQLYTTYSVWLCDFIRARFEIEQSPDAEDLAIETWMEVWRRIDEFPTFLPATEGMLLWWLKKIAHQAAMAYRESQKQLQEIQDFFSQHYLAQQWNSLARREGIWVQRSATLARHLPQSAPASSVQCTTYYPKQIDMHAWATLLFYVHTSEALDSVQADSEVRLGVRVEGSEMDDPKGSETVTPGIEISVVPEMPEFEFQPPRAHFEWREKWHCAEFRIRFTGSSSQYGDAFEHIGRVAVYVGPVLVAENMVSITVSRPREQPSSVLPRTRISSSPYPVVFASYAHADADVVERVEKVCVVIGMHYLRDVRVLLSGERWWPKLRESINGADIFQLFWSKHAKESPNVEAEWQYALSLHRPAFIRPVYWETPMPRPPRELSEIHFAYLQFGESNREGGE